MRRPLLSKRRILIAGIAVFLLVIFLFDEFGTIFKRSPGASISAIDSGFKFTFSLNQLTYNIGEPIIGTFTIKNMNAAPAKIETGGALDPPRCRVIDEHGKALADPLKILNMYQFPGGLGGSVTIDPGKEHTVSYLLNLQANPRRAGRYNVSGEWLISCGRFVWSGAEFRVRNVGSRMSRLQADKLFTGHQLADMNTCLVYGLQNRTSRISELIRLAQRKRGSNSVDALSEANAHLYAMQALVLMDDKLAVYRSLEDAITARWPKAGPDNEYLSHPLGYVFRSAVTPQSVPVVEKLLDNPNAAVADLAFQTALSMGSAKALERLPAALRSPSALTRELAMEAAFLYLDHIQGDPIFHIEGLPGALSKQYADTLFEGFKNEQGGGGSGLGMDAILMTYFNRFDMAHTHIRDAIDHAMESPSPPKRASLLFYLAMRSKYPGFAPPDQNLIAVLIPFVREQERSHPDSDARARAIECLGLWNDTQSIPAIAALLDDSNQPIRLSAAEALLIMKHRPLADKSIEVLCDGDELQNPNRILLVAKRLGMQDPWKTFGNDWLGKSETTTGTLAVKENRKAKLRKLIGGMNN